MRASGATGDGPENRLARAVLDFVEPIDGWRLVARAVERAIGRRRAKRVEAAETRAVEKTGVGRPAASAS